MFCFLFTRGVRRGLVLPQGSQSAAGRAERSAARVGEGSAPDRVVLEGAGLAAGAEVRVGRRFHGRHAGVIGVQVGVIHLIHRSAGANTGLQTRRGGELWLRASWGVARMLLRVVEGVRSGSVSPVCPRTVGCSLQNSCQLSALRGCFSFYTENNPEVFSLLSTASLCYFTFSCFFSLCVRVFLLFFFPGLQFALRSRSV